MEEQGGEQGVEEGGVTQPSRMRWYFNDVQVKFEKALRRAPQGHFK